MPRTVTSAASIKKIDFDLEVFIRNQIASNAYATASKQKNEIHVLMRLYARMSAVTNLLKIAPRLPVVASTMAATRNQPPCSNERGTFQ